MKQRVKNVLRPSGLVQVQKWHLVLRVAIGVQTYGFAQRRLECPQRDPHWPTASAALINCGPEKVYFASAHSFMFTRHYLDDLFVSVWPIARWMLLVVVVPANDQICARLLFLCTFFVAI